MDLSQYVMRVAGRLVPVWRDYVDANYPVWRSCRTGSLVWDYVPSSPFPRAKPYVPTLRARTSDRRVKRPPVPLDVRAGAEVWRDAEVYPDAPYVLIVRGELVDCYTSVTVARHQMAETWR